MKTRRTIKVLGGRRITLNSRLDEGVVLVGVHADKPLAHVWLTHKQLQKLVDAGKRILK